MNNAGERRANTSTKGRTPCIGRSYSSRKGILRGHGLIGASGLQLVIRSLVAAALGTLVYSVDLALHLLVHPVCSPSTILSRQFLLLHRILFGLLTPLPRLLSGHILGIHGDERLCGNRALAHLLVELLVPSQIHDDRHALAPVVWAPFALAQFEHLFSESHHPPHTFLNCHRHLRIAPLLLLRLRLRVQRVLYFAPDYIAHLVLRIFGYSVSLANLGT